MLTIDKAIEILTAYKAGSYEDTSPDLDDSLELGIEALKRFKRLREVIRVPFTDLLPGEDPQ